MSLEEIARATKVTASQFEALEADRFSELPAPIFVKGFIRAYCGVLGEAADEPLRRYRELVGEHPGRQPTPPGPRADPSWSASPILLSLALLIVFGLGLVAVNFGMKRAPAPGPSGPGPETTVDRAPAPPEAAAPGPPVASAGLAESGAVQRLLVKAIEATWIRIQADDHRAVEELLPAGARREWTAAKRFVLTVGNAGGIELELNGRAMAPLGARGAVIRQLELPQADSGS